MQEQIAKIISDPKAFIQRLSIRDKEGNTRAFGEIISPEQLQIIDALQNYDRVIVLKARQLGISTLCRAYAFWHYFTSNKTITSAVVSNKYQSVIELLKIDKRFLDGLPEPLKRKIKTEKRDELIFESNKSQVKGFSGGGSNIRGYTFNFVHLSEFDFLDEPDEVLANMIASANSGKIVIESTANFYGSTMHKMILDSEYSGAWKVIFLPWSSFPEYKSSVPLGGLHLEAEEQELQSKYGLTEEQIAWRRLKIYEIGKDKFNREYPLSIDEAYSVSGKNFFEAETLKHIKELQADNKEYVEFEYPQGGNQYVIGVDPAGGIGGDYSVAYVLGRNAFSPAAILCSNKLSIRDFSERVIKLSMKYKNALVNLELNNHGHAVKEVFHSNSFFKYETFKTSAKSKLQLYDLLRTYIEEHMITDMDSLTLLEMKNLLKDEKGLAPSHAPGSHDDRVIAYMLALYRVKDLPAPKTTWDNIMHSMRKRELDKKIPLPFRS